MDDKRNDPITIRVERIYDRSRFGPGLMAKAYEHLAAIHRRSISREKVELDERKEQRRWAM